MHDSQSQDFKIQQNVSLQPLNTLAVPACAQHFVRVTSIVELSNALRWAHERGEPVFVLGGGSNTVFTRDYKGLIILNRIVGIDIVSNSDRAVSLKVGAGENWHALVEYTVAQSWYGLENLALIPGLVGAAPIQNIGAYGVDVCELLTSVEYMDMKSRKLGVLTQKQCQFAYRDSVFKHELLDKVVIVNVTLRLRKQANLNLSYPALQKFISDAMVDAPTQRDVFNAVCAIRNTKLPSPQDLPNAGSFFKNPVVSSAKLAQLKQQFPALVSFPAGAHHKLAAAWLIENAGWKHYQQNGVRVHQNQALVIVNPQGASGKTIVNLAQRIQNDIKDKYDVALEVEPRLV